MQQHCCQCQLTASPYIGQKQQQQQLLQQGLAAVQLQRMQPSKGLPPCWQC